MLESLFYFSAESHHDLSLCDHFADIKCLLCASYSFRSWKFGDEPDRHEQVLMEFIFIQKSDPILPSSQRTFENVEGIFGFQNYEGEVFATGM